MTRLFTALLCSLAAFGCEQRRPESLGVPSAAEPSPNASVLPTPLAAGPTKPDPQHGTPDAPPTAAITPEPPRPLREDDTLSPDVELKSGPGLALEARFRWLDPPPPRSPEGNVEALNRARDRLNFDLSIELSGAGRMRLRFGSKAFPFPVGTELRARDDRLGNLLVWPGADTYTPLPPGTLRAVLGEARVDVTPLSEPSFAQVGQGNLLGLPTQKLRIETSLGKLELEQATASPAGLLLCRVLVELISVAPQSKACRADLLPLRADYTWASGGRFELEVQKLTKKSDLAVESLFTPPGTASARRGELPGAPFVVFVDEKDLSELHSRALPPPDKPEAGAPKLGLVFQNHGDAPRYLLVDGVPVVWLRADADWLVSGLKTGRYAVQARDFFGADTTPLRSLELPARFNLGDDPDRASR